MIINIPSFVTGAVSFHQKAFVVFSEVVFGIMVTADSNFLKIEDNFAKTKEIRSVCMLERTSHKEAKVTIAIPTYNGGEMLVRAVNSALAQVGYDDYNILIVDNNPLSTLSLMEFTVPYEDRINRISIYRNEENIGMCGNWNRCVELCTAPYMVMLHTDDYIMPDYLKEVMAVIQKRPKLGMLQTSRIEDNKSRMQNARLPYERFCLLDLVPFNQLCAPTGALFRTEYVRVLGGWNNNYTDYFDCYFNALFLTKYPVYVLNKPLTYYRTHNDYPMEVKRNMAIAEYYLYYNILHYYYIPKYWAIVFPYLDVHGYCQQNNLDENGIPYISRKFTPNRIKWSRRMEKYLRLIVHKCYNIIEFFL